ncbi:cell division protein FtsA [Salirhabdus euzebyi]|uniref:Cell division protein FtsA n=1 Tax=Salirhabdus euzebyi TaxID=394506 RepID=A0A841PYN6_9BACI|nr:cell division protein FtsA [Salirhabdus euzebyi]MBB6452141.1 cell division protein FtsA [Salirhabdus euzebyi]
MGERIISFDIGTRSVVGIILEKVSTHFEVIDFISVEHNERSMLDGQIHDILSVSKVIRKVKEFLEEKHGPIKKVCVAAAGRALKTQQTKVTKNIFQQPLMNEEDILHLELSAVQQAQYELAQKEMEENSTNYYCVGYSVLHYKLDGDDIGSLIDQQGHEAEVKIIATFLPKVVVESLISALHRADLEMDALTLEPIAAINVLIPPSMRRLNVALVDIGAGTSDIAITNYGTVIAYGMVPVAGDEITEAISNHYLLDFPLAEEVKREVTTNKKSKVTDILGFESEITYDELVSNIMDSIDQLANSICDEILLLNQKSPQAVMVVGGGSLTPELTKRIANRLQLPENRVAVRGTDAIQQLKKTYIIPEGPAFVTPLGIAIAAKQNPIHYISIQVNERTVRLFDLKQLTVGDCLLAAGININKLYGKPGMAYMVTFNGKNITIPGTLGQPPILTLNGNPVSLKDLIKHGDKMKVIPGENGQSPSIMLGELVEDVFSFPVYVNGEKHIVQPSILVNNQPANKNTYIQDKDDIRLNAIQTIEGFLHSINKSSLLENRIPFHVKINGEKKKLDVDICTIYINGVKSTPKSSIKQNDKITIVEQSQFPLNQLLEMLEVDRSIVLPVTFESRTIYLKKEKVAFYREDIPLSEDSIVKHEDSLKMTKNDSQPFIFQDIFRYIDFDISSITGKQFKLYVNGEEASFTTELAPHDKISIRWIESIYTKK